MNEFDEDLLKKWLTWDYVELGRYNGAEICLALRLLTRHLFVNAIQGHFKLSDLHNRIKLLLIDGIWSE